MIDEAPTSGPTQLYARRVGQRLRSIRRQKRLSLQEVEAASDQEFKASVLGAYERGERVISVPRLHRLALYYQVPVDQLLPSAADMAPERAGAPANGNPDGEAPARPGPGGRTASPAKITFDLTRFQQVDDPQLEMVRQYLNQIQVMRQDFNGRMLTIRGDDIRAIAGLFGTDMHALVERLDALDLRLTPGSAPP